MTAPQSREAWGLAYENHPLAVERTDESGVFEIQLPARSGRLYVDVAVLARGFVSRKVTDVEVLAEEIVDVRLHLDPGLSIEGRVVREDGMPVSGVTVIATTKEGMHEIAEAILSPALLDTSSLRVPRRNSAYQEATAISNEFGEFAISGLFAGAVAVLPLSYEWIASPPLRVDAGTRSVVLKVARAQGVHGLLRDRVTGDPILKCVIDVASKDGNSLRCGTSIGGEIRLAWRPPAMGSNLQHDVTIQASGYKPATRSIVVSDGAPQVELGVVEMEPVSGGLARLDVRHDDGSPVQGPLLLDYAESEGGVRRSVELRLVRPGRYEGTIPEGSWFVRVRRQAWMAELDAWRGEAIVRAEGDWNASIVLPLGGTLVIQRESEEAGVILVKGPRWASSHDFTGPQVRFEDFPSGRWTYTILSGAGAAVEAGNFDMLPGGVHEIRCR